jgi:tRNA G18 (ribose-2'-O)-methylase SpoU
MRKLSMDELERKSVEAFKEAKKFPLVVVLDNVRSMNNVGSIFRSADAFLIQAIYLCGYTPQPPHRDIQKTALGATETVRWQYFETTVKAVEQLKKDGFAVWAVEQASGSEILQKMNWDGEQKIALVLGNEVSGVAEEVLEYCDGCVEIPQMGMKQSLNISVAAGIVLWEFMRKVIK